MRGDAERRRVIRFERLDVIFALGLAGIVNLAMLAVAAKLLHGSGTAGTTTIQHAHHEFERLVGGGAAIIFAVALLASGAVVLERRDLCRAGGDGWIHQRAHPRAAARRSP